MDIQQFNSKIISITQLRRDIDSLEKVLKKEDEAVVMRNQDVLFVALSPKRYKEILPASTRFQQINQAVEAIDKLRKYHGKTKGSMTASDFIIKMRDLRVTKWKR